MALSIDQLNAQLDALVKALGDPALIVRFSDREVQYRSVDDIRKAIGVIEEMIRETQNPTASRVGLAQHKRGDGPAGPSPFYWERW